jgi:hypothetical protein
MICACPVFSSIFTVTSNKKKGPLLAIFPLTHRMMSSSFQEQAQFERNFSRESFSARAAILCARCAKLSAARLKCEEVKTIVKGLNELSGSSIDAAKAVKGATAATRAKKQLWRDQKPPALIKAGSRECKILCMRILPQVIRIESGNGVLDFQQSWFHGKKGKLDGYHF